MLFAVGIGKSNHERLGWGGLDFRNFKRNLLCSRETRNFEKVYRSQPATHDLDDHTVDTVGEEGEEEDGEAAA